VGDTLRMRLDQQVEMTGTMQVPSGDTTVTRVNVTRVVAHSVVEGRDSAGTTMLAVTDSVFVADGASATPAGDGPHESPLRALEGRRVQLRVAPDGATRVVGGDDALGPELSALFAQMPATLPRGAVAVGDTWVRTMAIPSSAAQPGAPSAGSLTATFRLDSTSRHGEVAHISMRGALTRSGASRELPKGGQLSMTGSVGGTLALDRRRGWLTDSRTTLTVHSVVTPPSGSAAKPMHVRMKVTQWLRAM
jgi:hypothetical protein